MKRILAIFILALLTGTAGYALTANVLNAQQVVPPPPEVEQGEAVPDNPVPDNPVPENAAPAANEDELSDEEIRALLSKNSIDSFTNHWKRRRGYLNSKECGDYNRLDGPTVFCEAADVPDELVQEYRAQQKHLKSDFLNEPQVKF